MGARFDMNAVELRERAIRLLAMALKARNYGDARHAGHLVVHAAELFGQAETLEAPPRSAPAATAHATAAATAARQ